MALTDVGLILFLLVLAAFLVWRLVDLFRADGRWRAELVEAGLGPDLGPGAAPEGRGARTSRTTAGEMAGPRKEVPR